MKKALALAAMLLLVAAGTYAQISTGGQGLTRPSNGNKIALVPADQYSTIIYNWSSVPSTSAGAGWFQQQSTAAGVTIAADAPFLAFTAGTNNCRALVWERGGHNASSSVMNATMQNEITVQTYIFSLDNLCSAATGWFQLNVGDSTNFVVNKIPGAGNGCFGIIATGSTNANNAYAQASRVTAFVSDGTDTTYTPFPSSITDLSPMKLVIHADAGTGSVQFWANDILQCTISSPVRIAGPATGVAMWINGAAGTADFFVGPVTVQRGTP